MIVEWVSDPGKRSKRGYCHNFSFQAIFDKMKHLKENNTKSTPGVGISLPQGYISVYPKGTHLPTLGVHVGLS